MKLKKGDLVRVVNDGYYFKKGEIYTIKEIYLSEIIILFDNWGIKPDSLEPVTHLTTKEFIKEVEKLGYEVAEEQGELSLFRDGDQVLVVNSYENSLFIDGYCFIKKGDNILKIVDLYLNTPLELREEKEQLYTSQCPITDEYLCKKSKTSKKPVWVHKNNIRNGNQSYPTFTQKEIDELPNQELIKVLKKESVK